MLLLNKKEPPITDDKKPSEKKTTYQPFNVNMMPCSAPIYTNLLDAALKINITSQEIQESLDAENSTVMMIDKIMS